jgi:FkbM family methyltransferase
MRWLRIIRKQNRPILFLLSRLLRDTGLHRLFVMRMDGYRLRMHPAALSVNLFINRRWRSQDERIIRCLVPRGGRYVDVGANIGQLVICAHLASGPGGQIVAVEPHPRTAGFLRDNLALNHIDGIRMLQAAAGANFGWVSFSDTRDDDQNAVISQASTTSHHLQVPQVRLEAYLDDGTIDLLKIDVEGYEKFVIEGIGDSLNTIRCIYFEVSDSAYRNAGYLFSELHRLLSDAGFQMARVARTGLQIVGPEDVFPDTCNVIAARDLKCLEERLRTSGAIATAPRYSGTRRRLKESKPAI